jgi:acetyltransferase-like isoleucine patch superfamily enzyme
VTVHPLKAIRWRTNKRLDARDPHRAARRVGATIGEDVHLPIGTTLTSRVTVGPHTWFGGPPTISGAGTATFGRWCAIGSDLHVVTSDHDYGLANLHYGLFDLIGTERVALPGAVQVRDAVWIGDRVTLLRGADVGLGCIVGAGAIVSGQLPPFTICVGAPAKAIRPRFEADVVELLQELRWWDWDTDRLRRNRAFFALDLRQASAADVRAVVVD